jgi:hypothetical protein
LRVAIDGELERAEMALGRADRPLHHREIGHARRRHLGGRLDQHRHVEMILEQVAGLDRLLVAAIDQDDAFAAQADEGNLGRLLCRGGEQCRHLGTRRVGVLRPAGGLADVGICDLGVTGDFREQRRLLGAAHDQRLARSRRGAKTFQFRPTKLARGRDLGAATASLHGRAVERHRVFARADQDVRRPIGHFVSGCIRGSGSSASHRASGCSGKRRLGDGRAMAAAGPACAGMAPSAALAVVRITL